MKVLISLSSFGAAETGRHGQLWCTDLAQQAGADGVEVRGELLRDAATELPALAGRAAVYSSPEGLWTPQGALDEAALARGVQAAQVLRAPRLKMSIGGFSSSSHASLHRLKALLQAAQALAPYVRYVHCKGVQRLPAKWVAVPLADSVAPWRAVLRALPADVPHAIEYPLVGDDLVAVTREQVAFIRAAREAA